MSQKIATVSTVFAACDRLDAANERWNREDVRTEVGGGGYVVIDPLIKAWRALKPLREVAPSTPAELLQQVAVSLEAHITGFRGETETRLSEKQKVFEATVSELSEKLTTLESALQEKETSLQVMTADHSRLTAQLEDTQQALSDAKTDNARLITENDGFRGQLVRMASEHKETIGTLKEDAKAQAQANAHERQRLSDEHATALASQRNTLTEAAEHTENRLMMLLDRERQAAKVSAAQLTRQIDEMRDSAQSHREKVIELETNIIRQRNDQNAKLESELAKATAKGAALSTALEDQKAKTAALRREFEAYQDKFKISSDLGALQTAVAALRSKLDERLDE